MALDPAVQFLTVKLEFEEKRCQAWCQREGVEFCLPARLAHHLHFPLRFNGVRCPGTFLPGPNGSEEAWAALSQWRHPEVRLNLLQLALIFQSEELAQYLWQPAFLREEDYRDVADVADESGRLVNHPLHLSVRLCEWGRYNRADHVRDELFYEEGHVDLTPSRILTSPCSPVQNPRNPDDAASPMKPISFTQRLVQAVERIVGEERPGPFSPARLSQAPEPIRLAPLTVNGTHVYDLMQVLNVYRKLAGDAAQPSTVELLWTIATNTASDRYLIPLQHDNVFGDDPPSALEDLLVLLCQCAWTISDEGAREEQFQALAQFFWDFHQKDVDIKKAARFLPKDLLQSTIRRLEAMQRLALELSPQPSQVLEEVIPNRSLFDLTALAVMEAVRGDVQKVWSLDQIPEPVKQLFHAPFKARYEDLKARYEDLTARQSVAAAGAPTSEEAHQAKHTSL